MSEKIVDSEQQPVESKKPEDYFFRASAADFKKVPGSPVAYWVPHSLSVVFHTEDRVSQHLEPREGLTTGNNEKYVRFTYEVSINKIMRGRCSSRSKAIKSNAKWFPYNKGGELRKWAGNDLFVVNWENDGCELQNTLHPSGKRVWAHNFNLDYIFRPFITWSDITSKGLSVRYFPQGYLFDATGLSAFQKSEEDKTIYTMAMCNSSVGFYIAKVLNPTMHFKSGDFGKLPLLEVDVQVIEDNANKAILLANNDWNAFETSWDFTSLPLLQSEYRQPTLKETYQKLRLHWFDMTMKMQQLEEENNRIFIEAYSLQDELTLNVPLKEITLTCNPFDRYGKTAVRSEECEVESKENSPLSTTHFPLNKELEERLLADTMKEFISYAVGCMFGRYSLDKDGLILANQGETITDYIRKVGSEKCEVRSKENSPLSTSHFPLGEAPHSPLGEAHPPLSFAPDDDNVIPILDGEWFTDDVTERFRRFVKVTFGEEHYQENLAFIEQSIGKDIRKYFLKDFYADHVKRYKKRPIYWMFSSPKGSFNALIYMHRYQPTTASVVLNGYLREFRTKLIARREHLEQVSISASVSQRDKTQALKEIEKLKKMIDELESWERDVLYPLAAEQIDIDLDDGVKLNYPKFGKALKKIVGLS